MPKINIDNETLDGIVRAGLEDMLNTMIDGYRTSKHDVDKKQYVEDIKALEHVVSIYRA